MKYYNVKFTLKDGRVTVGHGYAKDEEDAETKAYFRLLGMYKNIDNQIAEVETWEES